MPRLSAVGISGIQAGEDVNEGYCRIGGAFSAAGRKN